MTGHKTSGSWTDVTSIGRNDIVFEGRNKEYGAYYVRQRYNKALLLALLTATSVGVLLASIPFIMSHFAKHVVEAPPVFKDVIRTIDFKDTHPPIVPPRVPTPPRAAATNVIRHTTPVISHDMPLDDIPTNHQAATNPVGPTTDTHPGNGTDPVIPNDGPPLIPKDEDKDKVFLIVQQMPKFPGGSVLDYLQKNTVYPQQYIEAGIMGTVNYTFVIEPDGSVSNIEIQRGVAGGPQLSDEVIHAIKAMPSWTPGMQNGHNVRVRYSGRIDFRLRD